LGGVLASLRGEPASAERQFDEALGAAEAVGADWIRAVVRVLRAEHAASWAAHRSVEDARLARELLDPLGEEWWSGVARIASGVALSSWDDHAAAAHVFEDALAVGHLIPLERVRCTLLLGETRLRLGRPRCAAPLLHQASSFFEQAGARFWAARACVALAQAETSSGVRHWQRAHSLAGHDVAFDRLLRGPASFRVQMLGRPRILVADDDVRFPSRHARLLVFAVAAAGSQGVSAEVLHTRLWPEADNSVGARRLKTALWQARRSLGPAAGRLRRRGMNVALSLAPGECDLIDTIAAAEALLTQPAPGRHALADAAIKLSRPVMGNEEYADWVTDLQDRLDALRFQLESTASQVMPGNGVAEHRPG
jgi:hypothetical protein